MVCPTLGSRTAKEQNRTEQALRQWSTNQRRQLVEVSYNKREAAAEAQHSTTRTVQSDRTPSLDSRMQMTKCSSVLSRRRLVLVALVTCCLTCAHCGGFRELPTLLRPTDITPTIL